MDIDDEMKPIIFLFFVLATSLAQAAESLAGFVDVDFDGTAHVYFPEPSIPTASIFIQWPDVQGKPRCCIKIDRNALKKVDEKPTSGTIMNLRGSDKANATTSFRITSGLPALAPDSDGLLGMAVAAERVTADSPYRLRAQTHGKKMTVRTCFDAEGQNLIAQEGVEYQIMYRGFDYDIDEKPKCSPRRMGRTK
jgi:hypothetical protein